MSYLARPRAHFHGLLSVNMPTGNNAALDSRGRRTFDAASVSLNLLGGTVSQFREWMHRLNPEGYVNGGWNYYGDNSLSFRHVVINSVELPDTPLLTQPTQDACIGTMVSLLGHPYHGARTSAILVDLDPNDGFSTQLIAEQLQVSQAGVPLMTATSLMKSSSYGVNLWRNLEIGADRGASAVWYLTCPPESLAFEDVTASPFLTMVQESGQGLSIRLCTFLFHHLPYREIARRYRDEGHTPLPAALYIMGSIGLWHADEPTTRPAARMLLPDLAQPLPIPSEIKSGRQGSTFYPGAALAQVDTDRKIITVDLINTIPEINSFDTLDLDGPTEELPEKINLGALSLQVTLGDVCHCIGMMTFEDALGEPSYNRAASLRTGGLVEIPYSADMGQTILEGDLVLLQGPDPDSPAVLRETPHVILIDQRSVYLDLEDTTLTEIPVRVLVRGQPAPSGLMLTVEQTTNVHSQPREAASDADAEGDQPAHTVVIDVVSALPAIVTDDLGRGRLSCQPLRAGIGKLWIVTPTDPDWSAAQEAHQRMLRSGLGFFVNVRVLPDDRHYDAIPDDQLSWEFMYREVFLYYSLLYPVMNFYINFDAEQIMRLSAGRLVEYIAPSLKDTTIYMPITRELSAGKRRLIERWAALIQRGDI